MGTNLCAFVFLFYTVRIYFLKNREKAIIFNNCWVFFRILRLPNEKVLLSKGVMYIVIYFPFVTKCLLICMFVDMSLNDKATCTEYSMLLWDMNVKKKIKCTFNIQNFYAENRLKLSYMKKHVIIILCLSSVICDMKKDH